MDINITRNKMFQLNCCISGFPIPEVKWYHNNSLLITDDDEHKYTIQIEVHLKLTFCSSIVIQNASFTDNGQYVCEGVNLAGNITNESPAIVTVKGELAIPLSSHLAISAAIAIGRGFSHNHSRCLCFNKGEKS